MTLALPARRLGPLLAVLACLLLAGCMAALRETPRQQRYYMLEAQPEPLAVAPSSNASLAVRSIRISPGYRTRHLLYRVGEQTFESDYYNLFLDRPQDMITSAARRWLSSRGPFATVLPAGSDAEPTLALEGNVVALYGDFTTTPAKAMLEMEFFLLRKEGLDFAPYWRRAYRLEKPLNEQNARGVVMAMNQALSELLEQLRQDLAEVAGGLATEP